MELNKILSTWDWGKASAALNSNFEKVKLELMKLRFASILTFCKGYFSTEVRFLAKFPTGKTGEYAFVGSPWPGTVYEWTDTKWVNTGIAPQLGEGIFMELLKQHIDNTTVLWNDKEKYIYSLGGGNTYTIAVSIDASSTGKCTVEATGEMVSVKPSEDGATYTITAVKDSTVKVKIVPVEGYQVQTLNVDKVSQGAVSEYTFDKLDANHTMYVWMEAIEEIPTEYLVRSDLPDYYYSSTQDALTAVRAAYPDGLTQDVTITCVKQATEKRMGGVWIASLSEWNMRSMYSLTIDGADLLTYDGKSLGCLQFRFVDNVIIKNVVLIDFSNQATATTPDECEAVGFCGDKVRPARNLYIEKCTFNGLSRSDSTKMATMSVNCYNVENIYFSSCKFSGNYGVTVALNDCIFSSFVKNDVNVNFSNKVIAHPVAITVGEGECIIFEDNSISGDIREVYLTFYNISQVICRRNKFVNGGGQAISISSGFGIKKVVIESNLFAGMVRQPIFEWLKEYISLGGSIEEMSFDNNTFYLNSTYYEQYALRGGDIGSLWLHNNIIVDNTNGKAVNGFVFYTVKMLESGNNLYRKSGSLFVVSNPGGWNTSITINFNTGGDLAKIQAMGYEQNSAVIASDVKLLDIQNGGTTYAITPDMDALYCAANVPFADIDYKSPDTTTNSCGCYNLHGRLIDETISGTGYSGRNLTDGTAFSSNTQYQFIADSVIVLMHSTLVRNKFIKFSLIGTQHLYLILGKYGSVTPLPVLNDAGEYVEEELYTINVD